MKAVNIAVISSVIFAVIFGGLSLLLYFGDWPRMALLSSLGLFVGVVAAPEFEPKAFKRAWLLQLMAGFVAGGIIGVLFNLGATEVTAIALVGGIVGWSAPIWVKHVPIP